MWLLSHRGVIERQRAKGRPHDKGFLYVLVEVQQRKGPQYLRLEGRAWPAHPNEAEIVQAINTALDALRDGSKNAEQIATDLTAEINVMVG